VPTEEQVMCVLDKVLEFTRQKKVRKILVHPEDCNPAFGAYGMLRGRLFGVRIAITPAACKGQITVATGDGQVAFLLASTSG
jgi:hypothetical protein